MLIVGEKINTSRKTVREAVEKRDAAFIKKLAQLQSTAGAHYIDINCGTFINQEEEIIAWLAEVIQDEMDLPLCIDSPNPRAIEAGLRAHRKGQPMVNSISGETARYNAILPLIIEYGCKIVVLCMDDSGIPEDAGSRVTIAAKVIEGLKENGTSENNIYIDPLIQPISTSTENALCAVQTIGMLKESYPGIHGICGLSNISYGLPERKLLNQAFLVMSMAGGMDSVILDPEDTHLMSLLFATETLLNRDPWCGTYIKAYREGRIVKT
jgi:5-methyltetrahydrofolate corrinoid/iron sulfur protein methyltransferase